MKRSAFLGAAGAAALAACGGHGASHILPAATGAAHKVLPGSLRLVPAVPDPIPPHVLLNPIVGEAWRFEGASVPAGWLAFDGRSFSAKDYPALAAMVGTTLKKAPYGVIVAAQGIVPSSPQALLRSGRDFSRNARLAGAWPAPARMPKPERAGLAAQRELLASAPNSASSREERVTADLQAKIDSRRAFARAQIADALSPSNRSALASLIDAAVSGSATVRSAIDSIATRLSPTEIQEVLGAYDRMQSAFSTAPAHENPRFDAAFAAVTLSITDDQAARIAERE